MDTFLETLFDFYPDWKFLIDPKKKKCKRTKTLPFIVAFLMICVAAELFFDRIDAGIVLYRKKLDE